MVTVSTQSLALAFACLTLLSGCGEEGLFPTTVDPGPDFSIADLVFDESFFYCQVEPRVMIAHRCGGGDPMQGDSSGGCHHNVTSFRLTDYTPPVADGCMGNVVGTPIPAAARQNYQTRYPASLIEKFRSVTDEEIEKAIKPYVWGQNRDLVVERRKLILRRLDELGRGVLVADDRPASRSTR